MPGTVVAVERVRLTVKVGHVEVDVAVVVVVGRVDSHTRLGLAIAVEGDTGRDGHIGEMQVAVIAEQHVGRLVVGHEQIDATIVVEVRRHDPQTVVVVGRRHTRSRRDVGETPAAVIAVEPVPGTGQPKGTTVDTDASEVHAELVVGRVFGHVVEGEADIVGHVEIEVAVKVGIEEGGTGAEIGPGGTRGRRDVGESAVTFVVVEDVGPIVGHVEIVTTVVVDVAYGDAGAPSTVGDARRGAAILKDARALVVHQLIPWTGPEGLGSGAVDYIEVEITVAVVVEEGGAAAVGLEDMPLPQAAEDVAHRHTRRHGLVRETQPSCGVGHASRGHAGLQRDARQRDPGHRDLRQRGSYRAHLKPTLFPLT